MRNSASPGALLALSLAVSAGAQTPLTPTDGQPNTAAVRATASGFDWFYSAPVLGASSIIVNYDVGAGTLAFEAMDIRLALGSCCVGVHFCRCYRNQQFHLPRVSRPVAAVDPDGQFALTHSAVYEGESGALFTALCGAGPRPPVDISWQASGTVRFDPATGTLHLVDLLVTVDGTGDIDAATLVLNFSSGFQAYEPFRWFQEVGGPLVITGAGFTPGTVAKVFISTPEGPRDVVPEGVRPTAVAPLRWEGRLPWPWPLPAPYDYDMGLGFVSVHLVRTDRGYDRSNDVPAVLAGSWDNGVVGLTGLDIPLSATSWDPYVAIPNVEKVYAPGTLLYAGGEFPNPTATVINVFGADGNCAPPGGVAPGAVGATWLSFVVPAGCPVGPGAFQAVDTVTGRASTIVSAPLGEPVDVSTVTVSGTGVTVSGTGFSPLTAVNFFARDGAGSVTNFGGYDPAGRPRLVVTVPDAHTLTFELPVGVTSGPCFVEALNPPFINYTSSRSRPPGGECTIP